MNRRGFLRGVLAAAVGSCVRWLPMPAAPRAVAEPAQMTLRDWAQQRDPNGLGMASFVADWRTAVRRANFPDME